MNNWRNAWALIGCSLLVLALLTGCNSDSTVGEPDGATDLSAKEQSGECKADPAPPGSAECPAECTGGCDDANVCTIDCTGTKVCDEQTIECPEDYACNIICDGLDACDTSVLLCPAQYACAVSCSGTDACGDVQLKCGEATCSMDCGEDSQACVGSAISCNGGPCDNSCDRSEGPDLDLISEGLSSLDSIALDVEPLDSGPVEALDETAGPCLPNPCIDLNQTVCSTGPEGVLCTCDSGFRHSEEGDCVPAPTFDDFNQLVGAYKEAHPGKDGDINQKSTEAVANDPAAQELLAICGPDQRPVIPLLAWEYGGFDHPWEKPEAAALVYCVFTPVSPNSPHWEYEAGSDHVTADLYLPYPAQNPCAASPGSGQVADCIGDYSNFEILVDIASLHDGHDVGLELSEASTELRLIPALGGPPIHLVDDD